MHGAAAVKLKTSHATETFMKAPPATIALYLARADFLIQ
jgi:hypothetical protein